MGDHWKRLDAVARGQSGMFTRADATRCGVTGASIDSRIRRGLVRPVVPRVYLAGSAALGVDLLERAVLLGVADSALAEESAAAFWRWCTVPTTVTVQVPAAARPVLPPTVTVRRTRHPAFVSTSDGRRVTSAARTIVDLGRIWPRSRLGATILTACQRRLCATSDIAAELALLGPKPGSAIVRSVLAEFLPEFESILGKQGLGLLRRHEFRLATNQEVRDAHGRIRRPDALILDQDGRPVLDIEFDGWAFHGSQEQQQADRIRDRALLAAGLPTLRLTTEDVRRRPQHSVADVRGALRGLSERGKRPA